MVGLSKQEKPLLSEGSLLVGTPGARLPPSCLARGSSRCFRQGSQSPGLLAFIFLRSRLVVELVVTLSAVRSTYFSPIS